MPPQVKQKPRVLELTPEEAARVRRSKERHESVKVDPEWLFISEFGYYYGWEGVKSILNNDLDMNTAIVLLEGARKTWYRKLVESSQGNYVATASANSKKPRQAMKKGLSQFMKEANG